MSTASPSATLEEALSAVPSAFRAKLIKHYHEVKRNHIEARYDASGTTAGKLCEVALRLLQQEVMGSYTAFGKKIDNFADECRKIVTAGSSAQETLKVVVPRALVFLYTIRNKRGIGHIGGDVEANRIDSATIARVADWIVCELIRVYHKLSLEEAQAIVDALAVRQVPNIWEVAGKKRVLTPGLTAQQQALLLLYSDSADFLFAEDLCQWVEYSSLRDFRRNVLQPLHKKRWIEYDRDLDLAHLSPLGAAEVERTLLEAI